MCPRKLCNGWNPPTLKSKMADENFNFPEVFFKTCVVMKFVDDDDDGGGDGVSV